MEGLGGGEGFQKNMSFKLVSLKYTHHFFAGNKRVRTVG